jgi:hypothetical protein
VNADPRARERFVETLRSLLERSRDPELHSRIWDYREGKIDRAELYRDERFRREMQAWYAESLAGLAAQGFTPERVRARLAELRTAGRE